jgi:cytochrome c oxidase assembly protein subunit 15
MKHEVTVRYPASFRLALAITCLAALVLALGAYTRLSFSGLGCPDWPGCYGFVQVPQTADELTLAALRFPAHAVEQAKAWTEMTHRYVAGTLMLLVAFQAIRAWRRRGSGEPWKLPLLLALVVIAQALFGMWTVTLRLWPQVVTLHLLGGLTTFAFALLATLRLSSRLPPIVAPQGLRRLALLGLLAVMAQIALGGWTSTNYAGAACLDFPTCNGALWPAADLAQAFSFGQHIGPSYLGGQLPLSGRLAIQMVHRLGALALCGLLGALAWRLHAEGLKRQARLLLAALALQVGLGIANLLLHLPLPLALAHTLGAVLLLAVLVTLNHRLLSHRVPLPHAAATWRLPPDTAVPLQ